MSRPADAAIESQAPPVVEFNDAFLVRGNKPVDISRFARGNPVMPGTYTVDLHINGDWAGRVPVRFVRGAGKDGSAVPCVDDALLKRIALNYEVLSPAAKEELERVKTGGVCLDLNRIAEGAQVAFDQGELRLDLSVPQAVLLRNPRGYVSPELWTTGIPAATLGYNFNAYRTSGGNGAESSSSQSLGLNAGAHMGGWHLRHSGTLSWQSQAARKYQSAVTYVQHDIPAWESQLTIGDAYTEGQLFDGMSIRGVQLSSDDRMLPDSMRGYAPVIRGVARSNAKVTVTQNGIKLQEITVAPGAFEINDLYATGSAGELVVTVTEADGSRSVSVVPYSSVVQLLRPGTTRYNVAAGKIRDGERLLDGAMVSGTIQHGFDHLTGYSGLTAAKGYYAGLVGAGVDTPYGALAADLTHAAANLGAGGDKVGQSLRLTYSKIVPETKTNFSLAAYRYSSSGYWGMQDALRARDVIDHGASEVSIAHRRNQLSVNLSQTLGDNLGSVWLTGSSQNYWGRKGADTQFQLGYSGAYKRLSYSVSAARQKSGLDGRLSNLVFATLTIPLGTEKHSPSFSAQMSSGGPGGSSLQTRLSGTLGEESQFGYGVSAGRTAGQTSASANASYATPYATFGGSASNGSNFTQASASVSGGLVLHAGGITLSNDLGDTVGIVEAPNAAGASISTSTSTRVDGRGYAVVPYLTPYRLNTVEIDPKGLPLDVQFQSTTQQSAPRANSVVLLKFATTVERSLLLETSSMDGSILPFGAIVRNEKGDDVGVVGQNGRIFVRGINDEGTLTVVWGSRKSEQCSLPYKAPPRKADRSSFERLSLVCVPANQRMATGEGEKISSAPVSPKP